MKKRPLQTVEAWAIIHFAKDRSATIHLNGIRNWGSGKGCWRLREVKIMGPSDLFRRSRGVAYYVAGSYTSEGACLTDILSVIGKIYKDPDDPCDPNEARQYHFKIGDIYVSDPMKLKS